jgi:uncharacterized membrane protein YbhN (UPF0104 family)
MTAVPGSKRALRASPAAPQRDESARRRRHVLLRRVLTGLFFALVLVLLVNQARHVDWSRVGQSLSSLPLRFIALAALLAATSHALYAQYDLLGKRYTGHSLARARVVAVTFVSYAFNLNLGTLVGGVAFRLRLYSRLGLPGDVIARVLTLSLVTNWLGYGLLAGVLFMVAPLELPPQWKLDSSGLRWVGAAMTAIALGYVGLCAFAKRRDWRIGSHEFHLPSGRMALLQLVMSTINWAVIGGVLYMLFQQRISYGTVLGVFCVAAVAGVLAHVPAGLGVLEAVFALLLSHRVSTDEVVGVLLAYRALYYLAPLLVALVVYAVLESHAKRERRAAAAPPGT